MDLMRLMRIKRRHFVLLLLLFLGGELGATQDPFQFSWEPTTRTVKRGEVANVDIFFDIPVGHYLYEDKTRVDLVHGNGIKVASIKYPEAELKNDPFLKKELKIYQGPALASIGLRALRDAPLGEQAVTLRLFYQGCSPKICFREKSIDLKIPVKIVSGQSPDTVMSQTEDNTLKGRLVDALKARGWLAYLLAFIGGFLTDFTPCVLPLIPLTLAVVGVRREKRHSRNFALTSVLVLAMAVTYAVFGVLAAILGLQLGFLFQNPWFLMLGAALFAFFALGMFGVYELQVPLWMRNRLAKVGGRGYSGAAIAGVTMGILAAPCVGPVIGALLVWVAQTRDVLHGFGLLFAFGIGMGSLILVFGTFYGSLAGRLHSGPAAVWVKRAMGVLLLVPALYYGYVGYTGLRINSDSPKPVSEELFWHQDYAAALAEAQAQDKGLLIDFYADWCLPCLEWEEKTLSVAAVKGYMKQYYVPFKVDCTQNTDRCKEAVERYKVIGWPTLIVTDRHGNEVDEARLVGDVLGPSEFIQFLKKARRRL